MRAETLHTKIAKETRTKDHMKHQQKQHGKIRPSEIATGVIIGRTSEFFDFFVYAIASVIVFPKLFFPFFAPLDATLLSFIIFAFAFIARPIGTFVFMAIDRKFGREIKMTVSLFLLGSSTVAIAFLPGYEAAGIFPAICLCLLRLGQGFALGGAWDGLPSLLALNAPQNRRGWYAMVPQLGAPLGLVVASGLFAFFLTHLSQKDFFDWGWRYPFFAAFAINVVALFARLRIVSTPEYIRLFESKDLQPTRIAETLKFEGKNILVGTFAPLVSFAMFHMVTVFPLSWVFLFAHQPVAHFLVIECVSAVLGVGAIVLSGIIADHFGRRILLAVTAAIIAIFSGFAPQLLSAGDIGESIFMTIGFVLLGLTFGQASGIVASNFSRKYRYTSSAITSDLSWLFGAGFAPVSALFLSAKFGLVTSGAYLLSGALCTLLALGLSSKLGAPETLDTNSLN